MTERLRGPGRGVRADASTHAIRRCRWLADAAVAILRADLAAAGARVHAERERAWGAVFDRIFALYAGLSHPWRALPGEHCLTITERAQGWRRARYRLVAGRRPAGHTGRRAFAA